MNSQEHEQWQRARAWLPTEHAAQWTHDVREAWLRMRKAHRAWLQTKTPPNPALTSVKEAGQRMPQWIANDAYIAYMVAMESWREVEPRYINDKRARMSAGDFEEENK